MRKIKIRDDVDLASIESLFKGEELVNTLAPLAEDLGNAVYHIGTSFVLPDFAMLNLRDKRFLCMGKDDFEKGFAEKTEGLLNYPEPAFTSFLDNFNEAVPRLITLWKSWRPSAVILNRKHQKLEPDEMSQLKSSTPITKLLASLWKIFSDLNRILGKKISSEFPIVPMSEVSDLNRILGKKISSEFPIVPVKDSKGRDAIHEGGLPALTAPESVKGKLERCITADMRRVFKLANEVLALAEDDWRDFTHPMSVLKQCLIVLRERALELAQAFESNILERAEDPRVKEENAYRQYEKTAASKELFTSTKAPDEFRIMHLHPSLQGRMVYERDYRASLARELRSLADSCTDGIASARDFSDIFISLLGFPYSNQREYSLTAAAQAYIVYFNAMKSCAERFSASELASSVKEI